MSTALTAVHLIIIYFLASKILLHGIIYKCIILVDKTEFTHDTKLGWNATRDSEHQLCKAAVGTNRKVHVIRNILNRILISITKFHNLNKGKIQNYWSKQKNCMAKRNSQFQKYFILCPHFSSSDSWNFEWRSTKWQGSVYEVLQAE
jgi:hypothetical protein